MSFSRCVHWVLLGIATLIGVARAETPHGRPSGISSAVPTRLVLRSERTEWTFFRDSARVAYRSRIVLWNPGAKHQVKLYMDFVDATGRYDADQGTLEYGEPFGAPVVSVAVDGDPVAAHGDRLGDLFHCTWAVTAGRRDSVRVEVTAEFPWTMRACQFPDYASQVRSTDGAAFDASAADREVVFRTVPKASFMSVDTWTDGGIFERGAITWRWSGSDTKDFDFYFDSRYGDEHTEVFQGRYRLPDDNGLENSYFEVFSANCEESDLSMDEGRDDLSTAGRVWVDQARAECQSVIATLTQRHKLNVPDTTSAGTTPPLSQPALSDSALSRLNPVERRNLRYAVALLWAFDVSKAPGVILGRAHSVDPEH